jgi:dTDP-glucose 4,6-dehydratase
MKKLLVTGGAGFIGSNFIRHLLNKYRDYKIVNLDKLTYCGNLANLRGVERNANYRFIKGDICDTELVQRLVKGCDAVVNFAA